jgi:hypothetical protein
MPLRKYLVSTISPSRRIGIGLDEDLESPPMAPLGLALRDNKINIHFILRI